MNRKIILRTFSRAGKPSKILSIQERKEALESEFDVRILDCKKQMGKNYPLLHSFTKLVDGSLESRNDFYNHFINAMGVKMPKSKEESESEVNEEVTDHGDADNDDVDNDEDNGDEESDCESLYDTDEVDEEADDDESDSDNEEEPEPEKDEPKNVDSDKKYNLRNKKDKKDKKTRSRSRSLERKAD